jgi:hypothetical protein
MPVIGYLHPAFPAPNAHLAVVMRQVLADAGFVEGRNLTIEYRFAEGKYDRLSPLAAELVRRQAALIVAPNTPAALAAKAATRAPMREDMFDSDKRRDGVGYEFFQVLHLGFSSVGVFSRMCSRAQPCQNKLAGLSVKRQLHLWIFKPFLCVMNKPVNNEQLRFFHCIAPSLAVTNSLMRPPRFL